MIFHSLNPSGKVPNIGFKNGIYITANINKNENETPCTNFLFENMPTSSAVYLDDLVEETINNSDKINVANAIVLASSILSIPYLLIPHQYAENEAIATAILCNTIPIIILLLSIGSSGFRGF